MYFSQIKHAFSARDVSLFVAINERGKVEGKEISVYVNAVSRERLDILLRSCLLRAVFVYFCVASMGHNTRGDIEHSGEGSKERCSSHLRQQFLLCIEQPSRARESERERGGRVGGERERAKEDRTVGRQSPGHRLIFIKGDRPS